MSAARATDLLMLALLEGALVGLPRPDALSQLRRLRSPWWAAALPGSILIGTFAPLAAPPLALALIELAVLATLPLAAVAVFGVTRGPRALGAGLALTAAVIAIVGARWSSGVPMTVLTALACLALGTALARLIPGRWMVAGVLCMSALDVALLASGVGDTAGALLAHAADHFRGGELAQAVVGHETLDYPDLVLAAVLGASVAGRGDQLRAAWLVAALCAAFFLLAPARADWPATVPVAVALVLLGVIRWVAARSVGRARRPSTSSREARSPAPAPSR